MSYKLPIIQIDDSAFFFCIWEQIHLNLCETFTAHYVVYLIYLSWKQRGLRLFRILHEAVVSRDKVRNVG